MPECITIKPGDLGLWEYTTNFGFNTLGATTNRTYMGSTAGRTEIGQLICLTTVAASQPAGFTVIGQRHDTGLATRDPATVSTHQGSGVPFPVKKEQDLDTVL
jgi:hypothetical protein